MAVADAAIAGQRDDPHAVGPPPDPRAAGPPPPPPFVPPPFVATVDAHLPAPEPSRVSADGQVAAVSADAVARCYGEGETAVDALRASPCPLRAASWWR